MIRLIKKEIREVVLGKKLKIVLIVDEASLMRLEVFAEIPHHTQFRAGLKTVAPHHPGGKDKPHRHAHVSDIHASGVKNRRQKPHGAGKQERNGRVSSPTISLSPASNRASSMMPLSLPSIKAQEGYSERQTTSQEALSSQRQTANPQSSRQITSGRPLPRSFDQQTPGRDTRLGPNNLKNQENCPK